MVSQQVIISVLLAFFLTGVIPVIGCIVLLAIKKLKGSAFWFGFLAALVVTVIAQMPAVLTMLQSGDYVLDESTAIMIQIFTAVLSAAAMALGIMAVLQKSRNFKGAVSCGAGFGFFYCVNAGIGLISIYFTSAMINNGSFDSMYALAVEARQMTWEQVAEMKRQFIEYTVTDMVLIAVSVITSFMLYIAVSLIFMNGVFAERKIIALLAGLGVHMAYSVPIALLMDRPITAMAVMTAVSLPALLFALRFKDRLVEIPLAPPPKPDPFMESVEGAKKDDFNAI